MATKYVSQTATNGYVIGNDANDGLSKLTPWLTLDKVGATLSTGDVVIFNDGTYLHTGLFTVSVDCTLQAENSGLAVISSTNAIRMLYLSGAGSPLTVTLDGIVVDALGTTQHCITHAATANEYTTRLINGATLRNATLLLWQVASNENMYIRNGVFSGSPSQGGIYTNALDSGSVDIDDLTVDMTDKSINDRGVVVVGAASVGVTATVKNVIGTMVVNATQFAHRGILLADIPNAVIDSCNLSISGGTNIAAGYNYTIESTGLDASNGTISNNQGVLATPDGKIAIIGEDSSNPVSAGKDKCNDGAIFGNDMSVTNSDVVHGYMLGNSTGGEVYNNKVTGGAFAVIMKGQDSGLAHHNIGIDIKGSGGLRSKGCVNCEFYNNTIVCGAGTGVQVDDDDVTVIVSSGILVKNNIIYFDPIGTRMAVVGVGSDAVFANNQYFTPDAIVGNQWFYDGTNYATFELWQAAQELTAQYGDPLFANTSLYKLGSGSPCYLAGVDVGLATDFYGVTTGTPPNIGFSEGLSSGNRGSAGTLRFGLDLRLT